MKILNRKKTGGMEEHPASFSPGILSVQSKPPHPIPRVVLGILVLLFVCGLLWAAFGRLDIVAVAQGKLIPSTYVKIVQPPEAGLIREILVREGERVKTGQTLMRMDTTSVDADYKSILEELKRSTLNLRRIEAELTGAQFVKEPGDPGALFTEVRLQYESNKESLASAVSEQEAALERAEKELALAFEAKDKLEKVLPLYKQEEEAYLKLSESAHVGMLDAIDKTRKRIEKEEEYQAQDLIIAREKAAMEQTQRKIRQLLSDNERQLREQRAQLAEKINRLEAELIKQEHRRSLLELKAPQDGVVKDMATHTVGTVTQPGTILMTLVPLTDTLRAEVWLQNQDVGFVRPGQDVKLKLTAFQFQKYGMVNGNVEHVAADARDAGQQPPGEQSASSANPLTYRTLISLDDQKLFTEMKSYDLFPGMQVMAEIKLGERSVLEYLLSPVRRAFHQAGRER